MAGFIATSLDFSPALNSTVSGLLHIVPPITAAMHVASSLLLLAGCAFDAVLGRPEAAVKREAQILKRSVDSFIQTQTPIAWRKLLCNIGTNGCEAAGAAAGVVVASPSKRDPDYWYTWTRDAALVYKTVADAFAHDYNTTLQRALNDFVVSQARLQGVSNPSGIFADGTGLGEAKFMVDLSPYRGEWGRPQRDGPPLRAIALIRYAKWLIGNGYKSTAQSVVWPVIKNDLAYTAQYWNETGFDLWEEVPGSSFFTIASSHRALVEGAALATQLDTQCRECITTAPHVLCFQQTFWNPAGYMVSNINGGEYRSGRDANSILASIHNFDPAAGCDANTFQPCSDKALSNHKQVVDSFRSIYRINGGIASGRAVAVGRYSEDVYYSGNPWFLTTFAAAEQLYDAIYVWKQQGRITVTSVSLPFFRDLVSSVSTGTYNSGSSTFQSIISAVSAYADGFMEIGDRYKHADGSMPEQIDRNSGAPLAARDLTWSYASFLTASARRAGVVPAGWSAQYLNTLPSSCQMLQVKGTYVSATATSFPSSQTPKPTSTSPVPIPTACASTSTVYVRFNTRVSTQWGESVKVIGNIPALGNWNTANAVTLSASGYRANNPLWSLTIPVPAGTRVEYKYIVVSGGQVRWESDPNRSFTPSATCDIVTRDDYWR